MMNISRRLSAEQLRFGHSIQSGTSYEFVVSCGGHVLVRLLSPVRYPLVGIGCALRGGGQSHPQRETDKDGVVSWEGLSLDSYLLSLRLGESSMEVSVPWLRGKEMPHEQCLVNASELLGGPESPCGVQVRLMGMGYDCGGVHGNLDSMTKSALIRFQEDRGLDTTGVVDFATARLLASLFGA